VVRLPVLLRGGREKLYALRPSKIIALGLNYRDHVAESRSVNVQGFDENVPSEPVLFAKTPNTLIGPEQPIVIPGFLRAYGFEKPRVDYEAELAFIIGRRCRSVPPERAWEQIYGFTCFNDVSQRNLQHSDRSGWFRGKSLDTFGPIGPRIVPVEGIGDPQDLDIRCRLNGRLVQTGNTRDMIFPIPEILAFVSRNFTLEKGDIITTGTPSGVGSIRHGDVVEVEIEGIGVLRNPVVEEGR
jgi:2-keto-4-pentenoate hydratase/2-oxohepta-3-ene-1,7-dioic acid hydratase in catechol pathway